jgi:hypothetical protein
MGVQQMRAALTQLYAAWTLGRELMLTLDAARADGWVTEAELGALALRLVRTYERITGRTLPVTIGEPSTRGDGAE